MDQIFHSIYVYIYICYPPIDLGFLGLLPEIVVEPIYFVYHAPRSRIFESSQLPCAVRSTNLEVVLHLLYP